MEKAHEIKLFMCWLDINSIDIFHLLYIYIYIYIYNPKPNPLTVRVREGNVNTNGDEALRSAKRGWNRTIWLTLFYWLIFQFLVLQNWSQGMADKFLGFSVDIWTLLLIFVWLLRKLGKIEKKQKENENFWFSLSKTKIWSSN